MFQYIKLRMVTDLCLWLEIFQIQRVVSFEIVFQNHSKYCPRQSSTAVNHWNASSKSIETVWSQRLITRMSRNVNDFSSNMNTKTLKKKSNRWNWNVLVNEGVVKVKEEPINDADLFPYKGSDCVSITNRSSGSRHLHESINVANCSGKFSHWCYCSRHTDFLWVWFPSGEITWSYRWCSSPCWASSFWFPTVRRRLLRSKRRAWVASPTSWTALGKMCKLKSAKPTTGESHLRRWELRLNASFDRIISTQLRQTDAVVGQPTLDLRRRPTGADNRSHLFQIGANMNRQDKWRAHGYICQPTKASCQTTSHMISCANWFNHLHRINSHEKPIKNLWQSL